MENQIISTKSTYATPPGPKRAPWIEAFFIGRRNPVRYFSDIYARYGPVATVPAPGI